MLGALAAKKEGRSAEAAQKQPQPECRQNQTNIFRKSKWHSIKTHSDRPDSMTVLELNDLVKAIEESLASASCYGSRKRRRCRALLLLKKKTEFNVVPGPTLAQTRCPIKAVREITGLGLKEAKDLADGAPRT